VIEFYLKQIGDIMKEIDIIIGIAGFILYSCVFSLALAEITI